MFFAVVLWGFACSASQTVTQITVKANDETLKRNVELYLNELKQQTFSPSLLKNAKTLSQNALKPFGYYLPQIDVKADESDGKVKLHVSVEPNQQTKISQLDIQLLGEGAKDPIIEERISKLNISVGDSLNHGAYEKAKALINNTLFDLGYFDTKWLRHTIEVRRGTASAIIRLHVDSGKRYRFGPMILDKEIKANNLVHRINPMVVGNFYDNAIVSDFNIRLSNMPYFKSVRVYPDIINRQNGEVSVILQLLHKPKNSFELGGGVSTDDNGLKLRFKWTKPWITNEGHYLETNIEASQVDPQARISYTIPVNDPNNDVWRFGAGYIYDDLKMSRKLTTQAQRQWLTEHNWVRTAFVKYEIENYDINNISYHSNMVLPGISYARKHTLGGTTPYWGEQLLVSTEFASEHLASEVDLFKVQILGQQLRTYADRHMFLARVNLGAIVTEDINAVPISMRFFAGGDKSIRGYRYESIAPKIGDQVVGGQYLVTASAEYNYRFLPNWRAALFVDAGTATNDFDEEIQVGTGFGVRWLTPIGPVRIDYAFAVTDENRTGRFSITIGPEI